MGRFIPHSKSQDESASGSAHIQHELSAMSDVLDQAINVGANIQEWWYSDTDSKLSTRRQALIILHSAILANADSISILLRHRTAEAAKPALRSLLETNLQIEWVLKDQTGDTAKSYLVMARKKELQTLEAQIPGTRAYEDIGRNINDEDDFYLENDLDLDWVKDVHSKLSVVLQSDTAQYVLQNLEQHRNKKKARKTWYAINDGPCSIVELAEQLNRRGTYEKIYRNLSSNTHGADSDTFITPKDGAYVLKPIRRVENAPTIFGLACTLTCRTNRLLARETNNEQIRYYCAYKYFSVIRTEKIRLENLLFEY